MMDQSKFLRYTALVFTICFISAACSPEAEDRDPDNKLNELIEKKLRKSLPEWDKSLLQSQPTTDWSHNIDVSDILEAMEDEELELKEQKLPANTRFFKDNTRAIRFYPDRGEISYTNTSRQWDSERFKQKSLLDKKIAANKFTSITKSLRLPVSEFTEPKVDTQMVSYGDKSDKTRTNIPVYHLVTANRTINGILVQGSRLRYSVNPDGNIQRLRLSWPTFSIDQTMQLAKRENVIKRATEMILRYQPSKEMVISSKLAYVKNGDDEKTFTPSLIIDVSDKPTPFRIITPVVN